MFRNCSDMRHGKFLSTRAQVCVFGCASAHWLKCATLSADWPKHQNLNREWLQADLHVTRQRITYHSIIWPKSARLHHGIGIHSENGHRPSHWNIFLAGQGSAGSKAMQSICHKSDHEKKRDFTYSSMQVSATFQFKCWSLGGDQDGTLTIIDYVCATATTLCDKPPGPSVQVHAPVQVHTAHHIPPPAAAASPWYSRMRFSMMCRWLWQLKEKEVVFYLR